MTTPFEKKFGQNMDKSDDFQSFLMALSGQKKKPGVKKDGVSGEKKSDFVNEQIQTKSGLSQKKDLFTGSGPGKVLPKKALSTQKSLNSRDIKKTLPTGKDADSSWLMGTKEKKPEVPLHSDSGFLPRIDKISHPVSEVVHKTPQKAISPSAGDPRAADTAFLSKKALPPSQEPKKEFQKPWDPGGAAKYKEIAREPDKESEKDDRIALAHVNIRPQISLEQLLETMTRENATDLHIAANCIPSLRIGKEIVPLDLPELDSEMTDNLLLPILTESQREELDSAGEIDFSYDYFDKARFRINYFQHHWGIGAVMHQIPTQVAGLKQLGLPGVIKNLVKFKKGLILITGPSGSGKSTTIASLLNEINTTQKIRIITLEKPIEYIIRNKLSLVSQREIGVNSPNYGEALWAIVREDPDVIMVSELWHPDDVRQVLKIAETGHLVVASVQTLDCTKAIERLVHLFPQQEQELIKIMLSESLIGVVAQRLVDKSDSKGRVAVCEVLVTTSGLSSIIREGKFSQIPSIIQTGRNLGMQTLDQAILEMIERKIINPADARGIMNDEKFFKRAGVQLD